MINNTPLYKNILEYSKKRKIPFHTPGHKQGAGIKKKYKTNLLKIDLTELPETDNLFMPTQSIKAAQEAAAKAFGAKQTFFLTNGSTCGIQTMIAGICNPGDTIIVDRNCHSSIINTLIILNIKPQYIYPEYIDDLGITGGINPKDLITILSKYNYAKGLIITSPNYYGICSDVKTIADIVHQNNKILLVDEAHGAHFNFNNKLPKGALKSGADACVQSAHKTLPALTQASLLHLNTNKISINRIESFLKTFQSSSPSYLLMSYLDLARNIMQNEGDKLLEQLIIWSEEFRNKINKDGYVYCIDSKIIGTHNIKEIDLTRLVINFKNINLSGYQVAEQLNKTYDIQVEMADEKNIVCIVTTGNKPSQLKSLYKSINKIIKRNKSNYKPIRMEEIYNHNKKATIKNTPTEAFYSNKEEINLKDAIGKISTEVITPYPPGIPILCPGEEINSDIIRRIIETKKLGSKIIGLNKNGKISVIKK